MIESRGGIMPPTYFESTDAGGKDTIADCVLAQSTNLTYEGPLKSGGLFLDTSLELFDEWQVQYPGPNYFPGVLLAATTRDLMMAALAPASQLPFLQASHNSIRGAAYQNAYGLPLSDLFDETTAMIPPDYGIVALDTSIGELQRRVLNNPKATAFDRLVLEDPERVQAIEDGIVERCIYAGGLVVSTTDKSPEEICEEVAVKRGMLWASKDSSRTRQILAQGTTLLTELGGRPGYRCLGAIVDQILEEVAVYSGVYIPTENDCAD